MATQKKKPKAAPSNVQVFGSVKTDLGHIGDPLLSANIVNHILRKSLRAELPEALQMYADPEDAQRIMAAINGNVASGGTFQN